MTIKQPIVDNFLSLVKDSITPLTLLTINHFKMSRLLIINATDCMFCEDSIVEQRVKENFRHCMRRLAATVCVITCQYEGVRYGITATAVTSLCFDPVSILACINSSSSLLMPLLEGKKYCINLLNHSHAPISQNFSTPLAPHERFATGAWLENEHGVPYLADAQANLFCELDQTVPYATHQIVIGRVSDCQFSETISPLIYQNGAYVTSSPLLETLVG